MAATPQANTTAEMSIRRCLHAMGFRYRVDKVVLRSPRRKSDICFANLKIAIFIDGCFWHGCPRHGTMPKRNRKFWRKKINTNRARDRDTTKRLRNCGWSVIRIWEHEDPSAAAERIAQVINQKRNLRSIS